MAHVDDLAVRHRDVDGVDDEVLVVVPERRLVGARRHVLDVEGPVGLAPADPGELVVVAEVGQGDDRVRHRAALVHARERELRGRRDAAGAADVGVVDDDLALDLAPARCGEAARGQAGRRRVLGTLGVVPRHEAHRDRRDVLAADGHLGVVALLALLDPVVPVVVPLEGRGLVPLLPRRRDDRHRVAVRAHVRDADDAVGAGHAGAAGVVRVDGREVVRVEQDVTRGVLHVVRAEPVAVEVGGDLAEDVVDVQREAGQRVLGAGLVRAVDRDRVLEDLDADGAERQRVRLHRHEHRHRRARAVDREVLAVDLVAVGGHGDEVLARRQRRVGRRVLRDVLARDGVGLGDADGALVDDADRTGRVADRRPLAGRRVRRDAGVVVAVRPAVPDRVAGRRRRGGVAAVPVGRGALGHRVVRVALVVHGDHPPVGADRVALLDRAGRRGDGAGALHGQRDGARGRGGPGRGSPGSHPDEELHHREGGDDQPQSWTSHATRHDYPLRHLDRQGDFRPRGKPRGDP